MKYASDFRAVARDSLRGRWTTAVIAGLIAVVLGAVPGDSFWKINFSFDANGSNINIRFLNMELLPSQNGWLAALAGAVAVAMMAALVLGVLLFILGSVVSLGYCKFNLELVDRRETPGLELLFRYFPHRKTAAAADLLRTVYVILWSLLFIIPGIVAAYSYAMTDYILAENPELTASEAIAASKKRMSGNRFRLFCLDFSFIGWDILVALTAGIGNLWLIPYRQAAVAVFYREISGTAREPEIPTV